MNPLLKLAAATLFVAAPLAAQNPNASLGGTVADPSGAVLPNTAITVTGLETGVSIKAITNASGVYEFPSLQEGRYRLTAELKGFQTGVYTPVVLDLGANVRLNVTLQIAGGTATVDREKHGGKDFAA